MNFPIWFSNKIKLNAGGKGGNSTGLTVAVLGIALALIIMECTLAIVLGFKNQITDRIMGFEAQISVLPAYDYEYAQSAPFIQKSDSIDQLISQIVPGSESVLKFHQPGILKTDNDFAGAYFVGYDNNYDYKFEKGNLTEGDFPDFNSDDISNSILISSILSKKLGLNVGDKVYANFFVDDAIKSRRFEIGGIYNTGFSEYDETTIYTPISTLQKLTKAEADQGTSIAIYTPAYDQIEQYAEKLQTALVSKYQSGRWENLYPVDNVKHTGALFFNWLNLLDTNVVVIFILMSCVAAFTLISSIFILILDHIPTIGLLRSLGASGAQVRQVFSNLAMKILIRGILLGNIIGIGILMLQQHFKFLHLNPDMYYLPYVPIEINWWQILTLNAVVVIVAWCLLVIPSRTAAKISPVQTLNYE